MEEALDLENSSSEEEENIDEPRKRSNSPNLRIELSEDDICTSSK